MMVTGTTEIGKNVYEIRVNETFYKVYRCKPRLFRVTRNDMFVFNLRAFSIDKVTEYLAKMDYDDLKTRPVKSDYKMNFPISEHMNNLRYVIGDAMKELYGKHDSADEDKFGSIVGVDIGVIGKIVHDGEISEEDFEKICTYLKPMEEIKTTWKRFYVSNGNNI